jgi:nucleotide-binding universal stress UspA family protein
MVQQGDPQGIELAKAIGARVTGIHVSPTFHTFSTDPLVVTDRADDYEGDAGKIGQQYLAVIEAAALAAGVFSRFESRGEADYADRLLSAMRKQFGGHDEKPGRKAR